MLIYSGYSFNGFKVLKLIPRAFSQIRLTAHNHPDLPADVEPRLPTDRLTMLSEIGTKVLDNRRIGLSG